MCFKYFLVFLFITTKIFIRNFKTPFRQQQELRETQKKNNHPNDMNDETKAKQHTLNHSITNSFL